MFKVVPFKAAHLEAIKDQKINAGLSEFCAKGEAIPLENTNSISILRDDEVMACGGITDYWHGRGICWTSFSEHSKRCFVTVFRLIDRWLKEQLKTKYHRIELSIDYDSQNGRRRAEMLGFRLECELARKFLPNEKDCSLYSLVRGD